MTGAVYVRFVHCWKEFTAAIGSLLFVALLASACAPLPQPVLPANPPADDLEDTGWTLDAMGGRPVAGGATITLEFSDGQLGGNAGCNSYFGSYQVNGAALAVGPVGMTEMACLEAGLMEQEQAFLAALQGAGAYRLADDRLEIDTPAGVLAFRAQQPVPDAALEGTEWLLTTFVQGETAMSLLAGSEITALFADGQVSGNAGCNDYFAEVKIAGDRIAVGPVAATKMYCEGLMEQESAYTGALQAAESFRISGNTLEIVHAGGVLSFAAR